MCMKVAFDSNNYDEVSPPRHARYNDGISYQRVKKKKKKKKKRGDTMSLYMPLSSKFFDSFIV